MTDSNIHKIGQTDLLLHFQKIRQEQGEAAYEKARHDFAVAMVMKEHGEEYVKNLWPDLDIEALKEEAKTRFPQPPGGSSPEEAVLNAMRQQIPNLRTQAQFNVFMTSFDALRHTLNSAFGRDRTGFEKGTAALVKALDSAFTISEVVEKLRENPDAALSAAASEFKDPPKEFGEYDLQRGLLAELSNLGSLGALNQWYEASKPKIDRIVSQTLRNELFDAIRQKKAGLSS